VSTSEQKAKEKKDHPILYGVAIATIMLFVTTIYNLVLAHIWPVTIHFGDYSFANAIYVMVSVLTSLIIAYLAFNFAIHYFRTTLGRGLFWIGSTPEQRTARKRSWLDRATDGLAFVFLLPTNFIRKRRKKRRGQELSSLLPHLMGSHQQVMEMFLQERSENEEDQQQH
jgi:hypothetical protein